MQRLELQATDKAARYRELLPQLESLIAGEPDLVANLANLAAAVHHALPYASWTGFYLLKEGELVLGPFQGKVACVRIALGKGVCGTAAADGRTVIVPDVAQFPGHIACDPDSRSEIVIPVHIADQLACVIDVDSRELAAFDECDRRGLEEVAALVAGLDWPATSR